MNNKIEDFGFVLEFVAPLVVLAVKARLKMIPYLVKIIIFAIIQLNN